MLDLMIANDDRRISISKSVSQRTRCQVSQFWIDFNAEAIERVARGIGNDRRRYTRHFSNRFQP